VKLLLIIFIVYLAYRAGKAWIKRGLGTFSQGGDHNPTIDDVMVKDPICGTYFPRREGVELRHGGQIYIFCSAVCRDRFLEQHK
jgi:YHS domain-containing protein